MRRLAPIATALLLVCGSTMPAPAQQATTAAPAKKKAKKPAAAAAPAAPAQDAAAEPAQAVAPADAAVPAKTGHVLEGDWKVYWIGDDKTSQLKLIQAQSAGKGLTNFVGALASADGEACPVNGTVVDSLNGQFAEGIEMRTLAIQSYVVAKAICAKQQIWIEAFGLPNGKVLMSGRATIVPAAGERSYLAVALGR